MRVGGRVRSALASSRISMVTIGLAFIAGIAIGTPFALDLLVEARTLITAERLTISRVEPVLLRLAKERTPIKTIDPTKAPIENGQLMLDVDVDGFELIDVDADASSPSAFYMHFYYWMKDGVNLPITDSYYSLRFANDPDGKRQRFVNRFEALPVNRRADKLDRMIFPERPLGMAMHELAFFGRSLVSDEKAAGEDLTIIGRLGGGVDAMVDAGELDVSFAERDDGGDEDKIAARGLTFDLDNLLSVYQVGLDHQPAELPMGKTIIGKFAPQTLILVDTAGEVRTVGTHGADLIEIERTDDRATLTIYDYHYRERTHHFKRRDIDDDVRMNINPGLTHRLPASELTVFQRRGAEVAFFSRHQGGHLASLTIGEHADHVIVENDPLIMFGHDDGEQRIDGKGFIGNDIPITRTVFGTGGNGATASIRHRRKVWQDEASPLVSEAVPSLERSAELRRLFDLYLEVGAPVEYGPHSAAMSRADVPEVTKTRETMVRALKQIEPYHPRVSIDHGGLEVMHVFGWNQADPKYYTLDLLLDAGIDYIYTLADKLSGDHTMLFPDQASNVFYNLPSVVEVGEGQPEPYFFAQNQITWDETLFSMERLEVMREQRGFLNFHTYLGNDVTLPVFAENGAFTGKYSLVPWFNEHLRNMDAMRDQGDLWLGLNSELYDFQRGLDGLSLSWKDGCLALESEAASPVEGTTLAIARFDDGAWSTDVAVTAPPKAIAGMRTEDRVDYLWFGMAPREERKLCLGSDPLA